MSEEALDVKCVFVAFGGSRERSVRAAWGFVIAGMPSRASRGFLVRIPRK